MDVTVYATKVLTVLLISLRISGVLLLSPLFSIAQLPVRIRILFLLGLSLMLYLGLAIPPMSSLDSVGGLISGVITELIIGALLAFGVFTAFAAFMFGGRILDFQMGFGVANLIDPATNAQAPLIGTLLNIMGVMTFFLLDAHHTILRGIAYSFERIPVGTPVNDLNIQAVIQQFGIVFSYGIAIAAPVILTLLLVDVGVAVAARTMPQINIFIVAMPLKIFVGLMVLAVSIRYMPPILERLFASIFRYWELVLG